MTTSKFILTQQQPNETIIGPNSLLVGELTSNGNMQIDGIVEGTIKSEGVLTIGSSGRVRATVQSTGCVVHGAINGDIHATSFVSLAQTAKAWCQIETPTLSIDPGAIFKGTAGPDRTSEETVIKNS